MLKKKQFQKSTLSSPVSKLLFLTAFLTRLVGLNGTLICSFYLFLEGCLQLCLFVLLPALITSLEQVFVFASSLFPYAELYESCLTSLLCLIVSKLFFFFFPDDSGREISREGRNEGRVISCSLLNLKTCDNKI